MSERNSTMRRPKYLNLIQIRLPLPGFVSILHRGSGLLLIFALPFAIYFLGRAIDSEEGYASVAELFSNPLAQLVALAVLWAFYHHLCAGLRFLLIEMHIGTSLPAARLSSAIALAGGVVLALVHGWILFL